MNLTLFTPERATKLARELSPRLESLVRMRAELKRIAKRLDVMPLALSGADAKNPDTAETRRLVARRTELSEEIRKGLAVIQEHGCVVKDLDMGLLDFYALAGDRLIFLCWRLGEAEVSHWHTLEGGFATRQTLDRSPLED